MKTIRFDIGLQTAIIIFLLFVAACFAWDNHQDAQLEQAQSQLAQMQQFVAQTQQFISQVPWDARMVGYWQQLGWQAETPQPFLWRSK